MNLPPISPPKHGSALENEQPTLFKRSGDQAPDMSTSSASRYCDNEVQTFQPKYMTGYGGFQPQQDALEEAPRVIVSPVVGYTGNYRGRNIGKLGRCEVHKTRLSAWENDTVSGILGVPHTHSEWEYSHYTNGCGNFAEKKYHEGSAASLSGSLLSSVGNSLGRPSSPGGFGGSMSGSMSGSLGGSQGERHFSDGLAAATNARNSPSLMQHQLHREQSETDRILLQIQQGLESKFKTSQLARSGLKAAFFALDRQRCGLLSRMDFFAVLRKIAGVALSEEQCVHLASALAMAGQPHHSHDHDHDHDQYQDYTSTDNEVSIDFVNYGRFLNVLVPRAAVSPVPGADGRLRRRASVSASSTASNLNVNNNHVDTGASSADTREKSLVRFS